MTQSSDSQRFLTPRSNRPRRLRRDDATRRLVRETRLSADDLIYPVFVQEGQNQRQAVPSMPGVDRLSTDLLMPVAERCLELGVPVMALFPVIDPSLKTPDGSEASNPEGLIPRLLAQIDVDVALLAEATEKSLARRPRVTGPGAAPGQVHPSKRLSRLLDDATLTGDFDADLDTDKAVMRQLLAEFKVIRRQNDELATKNRELNTRISQMLNMEQTISKRVDNQLDQVARKTDKNNTQLETSLKESNSILDGLRVAYDDMNISRQSSKPNASEYSINGFDADNLGYYDSGAPIDTGEIIWQSPLDAQQNNDGEMKLPDISLSDINFTKPVDVLTAPLGSKEKKSKEERLVKAYTIPSNATLFGSVGMTALLGRIPLDGVVESAYPFKVLIGEENLSSNGIEIPNLVGITMSGYASGDWLLSCVSGEIISMTFTFADGTISSYPEKDEVLERPIGWFSDANGIPCVTGQKLTNAPQYLSQRIGLGAIKSYADAKTQAEFTNTTNSLGGASSVLTGDPLSVARNSAVSGSVSEVSRWLEERQDRAFDAIYVEPGTSLIVHVTQEVWIDYDPEGRKVIHHESINKIPSRTLD